MFALSILRENSNSSSIGMLSAIVIVLYSQIVSAEISGNWMISADMGEIGTDNAQVTLIHESGSKLSGTLIGPAGSVPISGVYGDNDFQFSFESAFGILTLKGVIQDDNTLKGILEVLEEEIGTFTGKMLE
jgi:hypothetical protein